MCLRRPRLRHPRLHCQRNHHDSHRLHIVHFRHEIRWWRKEKCFGCGAPDHVSQGCTATRTTVVFASTFPKNFTEGPVTVACKIGDSTLIAPVATGCSGYAFIDTALAWKVCDMIWSRLNQWDCRSRSESEGSLRKNRKQWPTQFKPPHWEFTYHTRGTLLHVRLQIWTGTRWFWLGFGWRSMEW